MVAIDYLQEIKIFPIWFNYKFDISKVSTVSWLGPTSVVKELNVRFETFNSKSTYEIHAWIHGLTIYE